MGVLIAIAPTILRAIKKGAISATQDARGTWQIESTELHRAYPHLFRRSDTRIDAVAGRTSTRIDAVAGRTGTRIDATAARTGTCIDATAHLSVTSELLLQVLQEIRDELRQLNATLTLQSTVSQPSASVLGTQEPVIEREPPCT